MDGMTRRMFLASSAAEATLMTNLANAAPGAARVRVGLYTITYLGQWYRGDALSLEQIVGRAKQFGYEGIEVDGKRPHGNPLDMPKRRCDEIRKRAAGEGVPIYAVAANNDLSSPVPEHREAQLVYLRDLCRMTADLGAKTLRVFLGWPGVTKERSGAGRYDIAKKIWTAAHEDASEADTWEWCRTGLVEAARFAGEQGVMLALQNHAPIIKDYPDVLRMVREVGSPHLKVCLDAPLLKDKDEASIRKAAKEVGALQVLSHFGGEYELGPDGKVHGEAFYLPFLKAMREIGYAGYIGYELCHPLPVVNGQTVGIDFVDNCAKLAAKFMKGVVRET
jgi:sugar phosphate isomerase/epimerase